VIALGEHHWASMRSGISKQYTFGTTRTRSDVAASLMLTIYFVVFN
jgi:hypothetical protein